MCYNDTQPFYWALIMKPIFNYVNRQLCRYCTLFSDTTGLMEHLFFVIGNGYGVIQKTGMIVGSDGRSINQFPELNEEGWAEVLEECYERERSSDRSNADVYALLSTFTPKRPSFEQRCAKYKKTDVNEGMFTAEYFYNSIERRHQYNKKVDSNNHVRTYPLFEDTALIYKLNKNSPKYLLEIALNLANAWALFLTERIEANDVWTPEKAKVALAKKHDPLIKSYAEKAGMKFVEKIETDPEESNYTDMHWTIKHRDMLVDLCGKLEDLLSKK